MSEPIINSASSDAYFFDMGGLWTKAVTIYDDACDHGESEEVTRDACNLVDEIEAGIRAFEAATMPGAMVKLRVCEQYLDEVEGDEERAKGMALSFARDMSAIIRTPGGLPLRPLVA